MKTVFNLKNPINRSCKIAALTFLFFINAFGTNAADYYWVGGSGNWSDYANHWSTTSGGNIFHTTIPTLNDDVYFDAASFTGSGQTVVFDNTFIYCNNMDWTSVTNNPSVNGLSSTLHVYGSLSLVQSMTWQVRRIDFPGASSGNLITTSGNQMDTLYFTGAGSHSLTDDLLCKSIYIYDGTFNSSGNNIATAKLIGGGLGNTVNIDLGSSFITISSEFNTYYGTVNMNSSNSNILFYNLTSQKVYLWSNGHTFKNLNFQTNSEVIGGFTCDSLTAASSFYINANPYNSVCHIAEFSNNTVLDCNFSADSLTLLNNGMFLKIRQLNISNYFSINGICGLPAVISPIDFLASASINKPSGSVVVDYCIITSINAGGGASFVANNSIDGGGNIGWTFNAAAPRTLYWVGNTGNWNDDNNWATSSGGVGGNCIPSSIDDVIFDSNSFASNGDSVILNSVNATCQNMDWTGVTMNPVLAATGQSHIYLSGSLALSPNMTLAFSEFDMVGDNIGNTILTAGQNVYRITIGGIGSWQLADDLHIVGIQVYQGTFSTANFDIYSGGFAANGLNSSIFVDLGTSTLYLTGSYVAFSPLISVNSSQANLEFNTNGGVTIYAQLSNAVFNNVTVNTYTYFSGHLICNDFTSNSGLFLEQVVANNAVFYKSFSGRNLEAGTMTLMPEVTLFAFDTLTIGSMFTASNTCETPLSLKQYSAPQSIFTQAAGSVNLNYTYLTNIAAIGGATFNATNSWDLGNNTGWNITSPTPRDLYWVGNGGDWSDPNHWALSSNGTPGNCPPSLTDNIIFDGSSFTQSGETIDISSSFNSYCNNISFGNIPANTILNSGSNSPLYLAGSATLVPELDPYSLNIETIGSGSGLITTGNNFIYKLTIQGSGTWGLTDNLDAGNLFPKAGTFNSNNYNINSGGLNTGGNAVINLGTSTVTLLGFYSQFAGVTIDGDSANIIMTSSFLDFNVFNGFFNSVTFTGNAHTVNNFGCNRLIALGEFTDINSQINAGYASFKNKVTLMLPFTADTVVFDNPGKLVILNSLTVNDSLITNGNPGFPIQIEGYNGSGTITKTGGVVCIDDVLLKDITATGGAQFFAGANSVDLGGNSGWIFNVCSPLTYVWPGDANYDLVADNNDILNIGLAFGYSGPVRSSASLAWVAQPSQDWSSQFANGANLKHADTDGNGIVGYDDTLAVSQNYGLTHPFRLMNPGNSSLPTPELYLIASPDTVFASDTVLVDIFLGTTTNPVDSIYGIAFTINVDTALVNSNYLSVDYTNCWMGASQVDLITFNKDLLVDGKVDFAIVRNDQTNTTGLGMIARMGIVIVDNVGAKITTPVTFSNITAITASEYLLSITNAGDSIVIDTTGSVGIYEPFPSEQNVSLYPNPANDHVMISTSGTRVERYEVFNTEGKIITAEEVNKSAFVINTSLLSKGVYYLRMISDSGVMVKRFQIIRN